MKIAVLVPFSAALFALGYLQALIGVGHPGWFVLAVVVVIAVCVAVYEDV